MAPAHFAGVLPKAAGTSARWWVRWGVRGALGVGGEHIGLGGRLVMVGDMRVLFNGCLKGKRVRVPRGCVSDMR
jgi:hypothetical protein